MQQERLTSSEISNIWTHYIRETMAVCITKYMMKHVRDKEIHEFLQYALDLSFQHINTLTELFKKEKFPIPKGFSKEDVNMDAPPLFTDAYCLLYMHTMTMHGMQAYGLASSVSIRKDVRDFYRRCNIDTLELYDRAIELLSAKNLLEKPPLYATPEKPVFVPDFKYVTDVFGKKRKINTIEAGNIFFNLQKSYIAKSSFIAFKQVSRDSDVQRFLDKCINNKNKHISSFASMLLKEGLHSPRPFESEITNSTTAPFSEKLMLFHSGFFFAAAISYYGAAAVACMRADIAVLAEKAILDDLLVYGSFGKLMIEKNWIEQPPDADDRKVLEQ